jgi:3-dehydrosphinganine reductase
MRAHAFRGRRALVTGGSSGIGRAIALALARDGAHVAILARGEGALASVRAELAAVARSDPEMHPRPTGEHRARFPRSEPQASGDRRWISDSTHEHQARFPRSEPQASGESQKFAALPCDVADAGQCEHAVAAAIRALGGLDLVVNNAGIAHAARFEDTGLDVFRRVLDVNFLGTVHVTRAALPTLRAQGHGHVVNVSSLAGLIAIYGYAAYAPSKFAVTAFSEVLRQELRPYGIGVSVCFPPDTDTPQLAAENRTKPPETRAIAGNAALLSAESVADALLDGVARGRFWIVPGRAARLVAWASRIAPGVARAIVDREIARARSPEISPR